MKRILGILATLVLGVALMGCIGDGTHVVGTGIQPGTYQNSDSSAGCYWERLSGFGGTVEEIIANGFTYGPAVVTVSPTDAGFTSARCGFWTQVANAPTAMPPIMQPTQAEPTRTPRPESTLVPTAQPKATRTPMPTAEPDWNLQATCAIHVAVTGSYDVPTGWRGTVSVSEQGENGQPSVENPVGHQTFTFPARPDGNGPGNYATVEVKLFYCDSTGCQSIELWVECN